MSGLRFLTVGIGDAFSALHYSCCLALEAEGRWLLVDCPHPLRKMLHEASMSAGVTLDIDDLDGVVVTHLHADHSSGLEGLGYYSHFVVGRRARLLMHPAVQERLWEGHLAAGMERLIEPETWREHRVGLDDYFEIVPLSEESTVELGPFRVECRRTVHHVPTTALRIQAGGRTLGISSDTTFDRGLIDWLAPSDLIIHETNLGVHTDYEQLVALPEELRARMRLIHYPDFFDIAGSEIEALVQGRLYTVEGRMAG